jgi:tRNA(Arg) A34 adenosine deaminase TadA
MAERPAATAARRWDDVAPEWRTCMELAWDAYARGSTPVGAIVLDGAGREVSRGTNARHSADAGHSLAGSHLAHAEVLALGRLDSEGRYEDHGLYSSLEPCLLCCGAAVMSLIGTVHWAGTDPYGGATAIVGAQNAHLQRGVTSFAEPLGGTVGLFSEALVVEFYLRRKPDGHVVAAFQASRPAAMAAAEVLAGDGAAEAASAGTGVAEVFDAAAARLAAVLES